VKEEDAMSTGRKRRLLILGSAVSLEWRGVRITGRVFEMSP
jgi:hypothetical protein